MLSGGEGGLGTMVEGYEWPRGVRLRQGGTSGIQPHSRRYGMAATRKLMRYTHSTDQLWADRADNVSWLPLHRKKLHQFADTIQAVNAPIVLLFLLAGGRRPRCRYGVLRAICHIFCHAFWKHGNLHA